MLDVILSFLGGGIVTVILNFFLSKRKQNVDEFTKLLTYWQLEADRLRQSEVHLRQLADDNALQIGILQSQLSGLKQKIMLMESSHYDLPLPQWLKGNDGLMMSVNSEYERMFLQPLKLSSKDYIDQDDEVIWGKEIAQIMKTNDQRVIFNRKAIHGVEPIKNENNELVYWDVFKYPIFTGNLLIGVAGIAIKQIKTDS